FQCGTAHVKGYHGFVEPSRPLETGSPRLARHNSNSPVPITMAPLRNIFAVTLVAFVALQSSANAATCTDDEQSTIDNVYTELANSTACGDLVADSGVSSLDYCQNSDCLAELSDAVDQLPDCTGEDELDRKTGLQTVITYCASTNEVLDQSASASGTGSGSVVSGASKGVMAMGVVVAQLSVALYFSGFL
ncbi:hypothetical protein L917_09031, partial [Phytophthora nicotianae]